METPTNEQLCVRAQNGDQQAESILVERNLPFIRKTANLVYAKCEALCRAYAIERDDLIQTGCIGLLRAIRHYNEQKNVLFLTFAAPLIRNAMWDLAREYRALYEQRIQDKNSLGLTRMSLSAYFEEESARQFCVGEFHQRTPEKVYTQAHTHQELMAGFRSMTERERAYMRYRYGFDDDKAHSLTDAAEHFHLRRDGAKKLEERAMDKLRRAVTR